MESLTKHFIKDYNITVKSEKILENSFNLLVFRVATLATAFAMASMKTSVTKDEISKVINIVLINGGKRMKGGEAMPAEFYGYKIEGDVYSAGNENVGAVNVGKIDWDAGIARPAQGPPMQGGAYDKQMQGGAHSCPCELFSKSKAVKKIVKDIIEKDHSMKISRENLKIMLKALDTFAYKLGIKLKDKTLTEAKYKKMINNKKFGILK